MSATNDDETREPEAEPDATEEEREEAEALARALERTGAAGEGGEPSEEVADLLRLAERVRATGGLSPPLEPARRDVMLDAAVARLAARRRPARLGVVVTLAAAAVVLAATGLLVVASPQPGPAGLPPEALAAPTDALFDGPFPEGQSPADRVDRILQARTRGYFAARIAERATGSRRGAQASEQASVVLAGSPAPW